MLLTHSCHECPLSICSGPDLVLKAPGEPIQHQPWNSQDSDGEESEAGLGGGGGRSELWPVCRYNSGSANWMFFPCLKDEETGSQGGRAFPRTSLSAQLGVSTFWVQSQEELTTQILPMCIRCAGTLFRKVHGAGPFAMLLPWPSYPCF